MCKRIGRIRLLFRKFGKNRLAVLGAAFIAVFAVAAALAPVISMYDPFELSDDVLSAPSLKHLLGTDELGRDIFTRIIWGARVSLLVGVISSIITLVIGILIGAFGGYIGGIVDEALMRMTDILSTVPSLLLAIVLTAFFGANIWLLIVVIGLCTWSRTARLIRADVLSLKEMDFTEAAKALGASRTTIILSEILPNALSTAIVITSFQVGNAILMESSLSFLGLGDVNVVSWGYMITMSRIFILRAPWCAFFPGFAIFLMVLASNLLGDGLSEVLNPRLRER